MTTPEASRPGRQTFRDGVRWEDQVGYARAVRTGPLISVAGTTATDEHGEVVGVDDAEAQARYIFAKIGRALEALGGRLEDVVRTRMFITDFADEAAVGRAHQAVFGAIRPAATMVAISGLADPRHRVEIEADAWVGPHGD